MKEERKYIKKEKERKKWNEIIKKAWEQIDQVMFSPNKKALLLNSKNRVRCTIVSLLEF